MAEQEPPEAYSPLRQAFYEAVESQDRADLAQAFLGAQLLRRQKVFRFIKEFDAEEDGIRIALYNDRIGNRLIEVRDPQLSFAELEAGRVALMDRLRELEEPDQHEADAESGEDVVESTDTPDGNTETENETEA